MVQSTCRPGELARGSYIISRVDARRLPGSRENGPDAASVSIFDSRTGGAEPTVYYAALISEGTAPVIFCNPNYHKHYHHSFISSSG